jgi:class 3 adenylate cyclase
LPRPRGDQPLRQEDLEVVTGLPILSAAGLDESEVLRAARVWGEAVRRVAQHQAHSFHELVEEPFRRQGVSDEEALSAAMTQVGARLIPYGNVLVGWLTVIIASRIAGHAGPGQVLVGEDATVTAKPDGVRFEPIGPVRLKDVGRPVPVYRALREGSPAA